MSKKGIFSNRLASQLIMFGANLVEVKSNKNNPKYNIYYFEKNDKLYEGLKQFG